MRRLFIMRKDLNMTPGKLAAQIAHCSEAYWINRIRKNTTQVITNIFRAVASDPVKRLDGIEDRRMVWYKRPDLHELSRQAFDSGRDYFLASEDENGEMVKDYKMKYDYRSEFSVCTDIYEDYISGSRANIICEAKNLKHLLKAKLIAENLGLKEGEDFGLIRDACFTELTPENEDGTCTTGMWFAPLSDQLARDISAKYQLYK